MKEREKPMEEKVKENAANPLKRAGVIQDLAGFGKCALSIVLPVLSAGGVECCSIPTAVLSSHTGGLLGCVSRDLTEEIPGFVSQWEMLGLRFDALYSGYLSSPEQGKETGMAFSRLRSEGTWVMVDPVMGDKGTLYSKIRKETIEEMRRLCRSADLITPNFTEAAFLLNREYPGEQGVEEAKEWAVDLCKMGPRWSVLTGVREGEKVGAAIYDGKTGAFYASFAPREPGSFHGTGDLFASILLCARLQEKSLEESLDLAVNLTALSIRRTLERGLDPKFGLAFEDALPRLMKAVRKDVSSWEE